MKKRMLWIPQVSSLSSDGKVLLTKDSNMSVLRNLMGTAFTEEYDITIAFEFSLLGALFDRDNFSECEVISNNVRDFTNAYLERFNFNVEFFRNIKSTFEHFDYVFVNDPTKVLQLKKIFFDSKFICYNHWLAIDNMPDLILRQYEGMQQADLCFFNSDFAIDRVNKYYSLFKVINSAKAQPTYKGELYKVKKNADVSLIYNHRLSSDPYYFNAFMNLIDVCNIMEKMIPMPVVYFTNPSGKDIDLSEYKSYFRMVKLDSQQDYEEFLKSDKICGHINTFFDSPGMWSMSTVDCARTGNVCFLPNKYGYTEIFQKDYKGYCNDKYEMACKIAQFITDDDVDNYDNNFILEHNANLVALTMIEKIKEIGGCSDV